MLVTEGKRGADDNNSDDDEKKMLCRKFHDNSLRPASAWVMVTSSVNSSAAPRREAVRDPRHLQARPRQPLRQIMARRVALHVRAQRDDDLLDRFLRQPRLQFLDSQILRLHAVQRRNLSAQHVILARVSVAISPP